jgi:hypothetical protein
VCSWDAGACKFKAREGRPRDAPNFICTGAEDADKVVAVVKHFTVQKDALRLQHQREQLAFLQARYAQEYLLCTIACKPPVFENQSLTESDNGII